MRVLIRVLPPRVMVSEPVSPFGFCNTRSVTVYTWCVPAVSAPLAFRSTAKAIGAGSVGPAGTVGVEADGEDDAEELLLGDAPAPLPEPGGVALPPPPPPPPPPADPPVGIPAAVSAWFAAPVAASRTTGLRTVNHSAVNAIAASNTSAAALPTHAGIAASCRRLASSGAGAFAPGPGLVPALAGWGAYDRG